MWSLLKSLGLTPSRLPGLKKLGGLLDMHSWLWGQLVPLLAVAL